MGRAGQREEVPSRHLWPCTKGLHGETFYNCKCLTWTNRPLLPAPRPPAPTRPGTRASRERCGAGVGQGPCLAARQGSSPSAHQTPGQERLCTRGHAASTLCGEGEMEEGRGGEAALRSLWSHQLPHAHEQEHTLTPAAAASAFRHLHLHLLDTLPESPLGGGD